MNIQGRWVEGIEGSNRGQRNDRQEADVSSCRGPSRYDFFGPKDCMIG